MSEGAQVLIHFSVILLALIDIGIHALDLSKSLREIAVVDVVLRRVRDELAKEHLVSRETLN